MTKKQYAGRGVEFNQSMKLIFRRRRICLLWHEKRRKNGMAIKKSGDGLHPNELYRINPRDRNPVTDSRG